MSSKNNSGGANTGEHGITPLPVAKKQKLDDEPLLNSIYITCPQCNDNMPLDRFSRVEQQKGSSNAICQFCLTCPNTSIQSNTTTKVCAICRTFKSKVEYTKTMWKRSSNYDRRKCRVCQENKTTLSGNPKENNNLKDPPVVQKKENTLRHACTRCNIAISRKYYDADVWDMDTKRLCQKCTSNEIAENKRRAQEKCKAFLENQRKGNIPAKAEVFDLRSCTDCDIEKSIEGYSSKFWNKLKKRLCLDCEAKALAERKRMEEERAEKIKRQNEVWEKKRLEDDRLAKLPRKCTTCNFTKPKSDFSEHQWRHPIRDDEKTRECLLCLPKEKEEEAIRLATIKIGLKHAFELFQEYGSVCYNFGTAEFSFAEPTSYINLVGTYDIIFSAGYSNEQSDTQRTCNGTLTLAPNKNVDNDEQNGIHVSGDVKMDNNCKDPDNSIFGVEFTMEQLEINRDSYEFEVGGRVAEHCFEQVKATVKEIKSRVGLPWWDALSYIGITNAQATALFSSQLHASTNYDKSWIVNHLPITNSDIAKKIHEYATPWTPEPVFFVEPGDLWIEVVWDKSFRDRCETYLIARRRKGFK